MWYACTTPMFFVAIRAVRGVRDSVQPLAWVEPARSWAGTFCPRLQGVECPRLDTLPKLIFGDGLDWYARFLSTLFV